MEASLACDGAPATAAELALVDDSIAFARARPQLVTAGIAAVSVEASLAFRPGSASSRRYIVGIPLAALARSPWSELRQWLRVVAAPDDVLACLQRLEAEREVATAVHLGWERKADGSESRRF